MMDKMLWYLGLTGLGSAAAPAALEAATRPELAMVAAGLRLPAGAVWLLAPMFLAVAGAVTLGWRRAGTRQPGARE